MGGMSNDNQVESVFPLFDFFLSEKVSMGRTIFSCLPAIGADLDLVAKYFYESRVLTEAQVCPPVSFEKAYE